MNWQRGHLRHPPRLHHLPHVVARRRPRALVSTLRRLRPLLESGHRLRLPDPDTKRHSEEIAKEPEKVLSPQEIAIVAETFGRALTNPHSPPLAAGHPPYKPPVIYAAAIERTHFHLLTGI